MPRAFAFWRQRAPQLASGWHPSCRQPPVESHLPDACISPALRLDHSREFAESLAGGHLGPTTKWRRCALSHESDAEAIHNRQESVGIAVLHSGFQAVCRWYCERPNRLRLACLPAPQSQLPSDDQQRTVPFPAACDGREGRQVLWLGVTRCARPCAFLGHPTRSCRLLGIGRGERAARAPQNQCRSISEQSIHLAGGRVRLRR